MRVRRLVPTLLATAALSIAGCGSLDDAQQVAGRSDLINDLATRLDQAGGLNYSADYQMVGGGSARIVQAQQPQRSAYDYPSGRLILTADATMDCRGGAGRTTCTVTTPPSPAGSAPESLFEDAARHGLVTPVTVIKLLNATAQDADVLVEQNDTTVAGEHATCVRVSQARGSATSEVRFTACVTTDGVLGSFSGRVSGAYADFSLTGLRQTVDAAAFDLPAGAKIVDNRPN